MGGGEKKICFHKRERGCAVLHFKRDLWNFENMVKSLEDLYFQETLLNNWGKKTVTV